ncbi:hypothetical protein Sste5346_009891 [Sporothrix stenoceras]|uniref:Protein kinase domain-containing protein n=1 Tax=Sporothrix stenoceras TaxID=5173 RepID=A0ABR3YHZ5_9PEZI
MYTYGTKPPQPRPADFPYHAGQSFRIRRHLAPPPFGYKYKVAKGLRQITNYWLEPLKSQQLTPLERCLRHPPQERPPDEYEEDEDGNNNGVKDGKKDVEEKDDAEDNKNDVKDGKNDYDASFYLNDMDKVYTLHIVDEIVARAGHGAQILRCRIDGFGSDGNGSDEPKYVAKIYDAAYYKVFDGNDDDDDCFDGDVSFEADREYSTEVAAYEQLYREDANGRYTPAYYASWTFDMPVPQVEGCDRPATRPVRLIVMEYLAGTDMYKLMVKGAVDTIPVPRRLELMAEMMECQCQIEFLGVTHVDLEPRNVLVLESALNQDIVTDPNDVAVFIIDFGRSYVLDSYWMKDLSWRPRLPKVRNPILRYWNHTLQEFGPWIPYIYHMRWPAFNGWLQHRWADSAEKYAVPTPFEREHYGLDDETEYIPPESISLPETRIPGKIVRSLDPDFMKRFAYN